MIARFILSLLNLIRRFTTRFAGCVADVQVIYGTGLSSAVTIPAFRSGRIASA